MATGSDNDKTVKIGFETTANTKGAEETIEKVKEIGSATRVAIGTEETYADFLADNEKRQKQYAENEKKRLSEVGAAIDDQREKLEAQRQEDAEWSKSFTSPVNPMTDGSMQAAEERLAEAKRQTTEATKQEAEAEVERGRAADEAARKQQDADVERAKGLRDTRDAASDAAPQIDKVVGLQRAQIALQIGEAIGRMAIATRALAQDLQAADVKGAGLVSGLATGMESVSSAVSGAATGFAVGGPLGAGIGGIAGLLSGPLKTAISDTIAQYKALKESQDNAATAAKNLKATQEAASLEGKRNFLVEYFQQGKAAIDATAAAIERNRRLLDATTKADISGRETNQALALGAGANPNAVGNADIQGDFANKIEELNQRIKATEEQAAIAEKRAQDAETKANLTTTDEGFTEAEIKAAQADSAAAKVAANEAKLEVAAQAEIAAQDTRTLLDELRLREAASVKGLQDQEVAKSNEIIRVVESSGQKLSGDQQRALDRTKEALSDSQLSAQEQANLSNDLRTVLGGFRATIAENVQVAKLFTDVVTLQNTNVTELKNVVAGLKAQVEDLRVQIKTITTPQSSR